MIDADYEALESEAVKQAYTYSDDANEAASFADGFLAGGMWLNANQWFSVNDRTPAEDVEVIVLDEDGRISFGYIVNKEVAIGYDGWNIPGVSFWMPYRPSKDINEFYNNENNDGK